MNAMLLSFPAERLLWLEEISKKYKIYLFSNTNCIHYNAFQNIFRENTGKQNLDGYFIKAYYSHQLGLRKPGEEAFVEILKRENLGAEETLFIDDTPVNIEGAKRAGMQGILLQSPKTVFDLDL
jgi:glucose-1-phosphatase